MKKRIISVLLSATMVASMLVGCGGGEEKKEDVNNEGTEAGGEESKDGYSGKMVISIHDQLNNPAIVEGIEAVGATDKWKNVEIEVKPKDQEYAVNMPVQIMGGEQIDIIYNFNPIEQAKNSAAGLCVPLDDIVADLGINMEERYGNKAADGKNQEGELVAIPGAYTTWSLFYNKALFDDAGIPYPDPDVPMTWTEYRELAKKLTSGEGADKIYGTLNLQWPMYWYGQAIMELGGGQNFYNAEGLSNIEDPAFVNALESTYNMQNVDKSTPTQADIIARKIEPDGYFNGKYAMYIHGNWFLNWMADTEVYPRDYEIGMAPMPVPEGSTDKMTWGVTGTYSVGATSANPTMATDFIIDLVAYATEHSPAEAYADTTVEATALYQDLGIKDEGYDPENVKKYFANPEVLSVTEKVTGQNSAKYETIINEEVEKYFADAQDLDTTIQNIKERGNVEIQQK